HRGICGPKATAPGWLRPRGIKNTANSTAGFMFELRLCPVVGGSNLNALAELSLAFANRGDKIRKRTGSILPNRGRPGRRMSGTTGEVTILLGQLSSGDSDAANRLIPLVFHELRQLA